MSSKTVKLKDNKGNLLSFYPIGSIYMSVIDVNPSEWFGGVWEQIKDVFLLGCSDTFPAGQIGGEKEHILIVDEMPSHTHNVTYNNNIMTYQSGSASAENTNIIGTNSTKKTTNTGGNQPHNNMPPYIAVYIYKRIA